MFTSGRCCCFRGVTCSRAVDVVVTEVSRVHECEQLEQRQQLAELQQKLNDSSREHSKTGGHEGVKQSPTVCVRTCTSMYTVLVNVSLHIQVHVSV